MFIWYKMNAVLLLQLSHSKVKLIVIENKRENFTSSKVEQLLPNPLFDIHKIHSTHVITL